MTSTNVQGDVEKALRSILKAKGGLLKAQKEASAIEKHRKEIVAGEAKIAALVESGGKKNTRSKATTATASPGSSSGATSARRSTGRGTKKKTGADGGAPPSKRPRRSP